MILRPAFALLCLLPAAGCHLVDQRDFDANAGKKPVPAAVAAPVGPKGPGPLVKIRFGAGEEPAYREALAVAVQRALTRKHDVLFTVTSLVAAAGSVQAQENAEAAAIERGREVAQAIVDEGAERGQVEQAVRAEPGVTGTEVRVDVH